MANCENCIKSDVCKNYEPKSTVACEHYSEPIKHGVWEREIGDAHSNGIVYYCTSCGKNIIMFNSNLMPTIKYTHPYVFELPTNCPNCGAKMSKA